MSKSNQKTFLWCTYRNWSFRVLEGLCDLPEWKLGGIITTKTCCYNFSRFIENNVPILRVDPKTTFLEGGEGSRLAAETSPDAIFHYGWSWIVPDQICHDFLNVTLHPGKLPKDRGGSPLQNQIRNGENWTYANIIQLVPELDAGPVFLREKFSLEGDEIEQVWARMISTGIYLTRRFLIDLANEKAIATPQDSSTPTTYRRVSKAQSILDPTQQSAKSMYDIVRSSNETDPDSYLSPASLKFGSLELIIERAYVHNDDTPASTPVRYLKDEANPFETCMKVNNNQLRLLVEGADGEFLCLTRYSIRSIESE